MLIIDRYKNVRNEYAKIRGEAQVEYGRYLDKCKDQPKLFYSYVKSKTKVKHKIQCTRITGEEKTYTNEEEICEILNKKFQPVLTKEKYLKQTKALIQEHINSILFQ